MKLRFDQGPNGKPARFARPERIICAESLSDVPKALAALRAAQAQGAWLAGYTSYELGYALEPRLTALMPDARRLPLLSFGVFDAPEAAPPLQKGPADLGVFTPAWDQSRYTRAFARLHDWIGAGDIYQANLTFALEAEAQGTPEALYAALAARQTVGYGVLIEQEGRPAILSRSPELFFRIDADRQISTRPMKGTAPRGANAALDAALRQALRED